MAKIAKRKTSRQLKMLLCDKSLHDRQVFERGKDQIIYSCVYRYAAITLAEDMIPSPDQNGNYIDIDIGDNWTTTDPWVDRWELKIKDRALKRAVKASLSEDDDESSPFSRIGELGFDNVDGSWAIRVAERRSAISFRSTSTIQLSASGRLSEMQAASVQCSFCFVL